MTTAHTSLTMQMLEWIAEHPRTHAELMEAWRTTCPRMAIWEDACADGLVDGSAGGVLRVTDAGLKLLRARQPA